MAGASVNEEAATVGYSRAAPWRSGSIRGESQSLHRERPLYRPCSARAREGDERCRSGPTAPAAGTRPASRTTTSLGRRPLDAVAFLDYSQKHTMCAYEKRIRGRAMAVLGRPPTRTAILDALEGLLGVLGYRKVTVDDVARAAGISRRTFYLHFPGKEEAT